MLRYNDSSPTRYSYPSILAPGGWRVKRGWDKSGTKGDRAQNRAEKRPIMEVDRDAGRRSGKQAEERPKQA